MREEAIATTSYFEVQQVSTQSSCHFQSDPEQQNIDIRKDDSTTADHQQETPYWFLTNRRWEQTLSDISCHVGRV
jgi:hypothetical protein